ncbi:MAG TPA: Tol-Pal system beta propeller repeat protein TolB [Aquabacterium sp.]|uniref:Tol-Pal system beta propeller repeat protein TolB n=1 Tax=Aquabacterium sp. TaxID=1872578 RepID=UPI002E34E398|nr:Tol-Pal system beta propeller repeat protein TolB [Aquabacterium sp.]HEX5371821.1 Tol-Pal system beta propeller repeat protein TolB [Aquabacterium sp.]
MALATVAWAAPAQAQFRVQISGVGATQIPLAIGRFRDETRSPQAISAIVRADLERSGLFKSLDATLDKLDESSRPPLNDWRTKGADALLAGSVTPLADGRYDVRYRLWDVLKAKDLGGQSLVVPAADLRLAAHRIADDIYEKLTGDRGAFATRIAYVSKVGRKYTLLVADSDGEGAQAALTSAQPIISPAWAPDGRRLAYVSFEGGKAVVVSQDVASGRRQVLAAFKGTNSAPAWSPDGRQLVVTLSREGGSQLYLIDTNGEGTRRLTTSNAIDTEAAWSPDGSQVYFVSDRGGGPQIYRVPVAGGNPQRVTFKGGYNISPAISPDGKWMAYVSQVGSAFVVHVMELATGEVRALTDTRDDESPSFAPNGRWLIYATRAQGRDVLMTTTLDGKIKAMLTTTLADVREPVWGPDIMARP